MTDAAHARATVQAHLDSDDFELEEFPQGWRVIRQLPPDTIGAPNFVVERETGVLLMFPSAVPPRRLIEDFPQVRAMGIPIEPDRG